MRPLMAEAYRGLAEGVAPIVVAPTGYGKTMASPEMAERAAKEGLAGGLIHIAPLRSLVRKIYEAAFKAHGGGYQFHSPAGLEPDRKSPYLLKTPVAVSLDSYLWTLYRIPVVEAASIERGLSEGHYYPAAASIFTSVNVFDEAHLFLGETGDQGLVVESVKAAVRLLAAARTPLVIETATMPRSILNSIARLVERQGTEPRVYTLPCIARSLNLENDGLEYRGVDDREWLDGASRIHWTTLYREGWTSRVFSEIISDARNGKVLVVLNTVSRAVEIYKELVERVVGEGMRITLIHGRLSAGDRASAEDSLGFDGEGHIVVATPLVEAGVDVNSTAVYTEVAPAENLVQRAGRACRRGRALGSCMENGGKVVIVGGEGDAAIYSTEAVRASLDAIKSMSGNIDWRYPCGESSYISLLNRSEASTTHITYLAKGRRIYENLFAAYLSSDGRPSALLSVLDNTELCSLLRTGVMVEVLVDSRDSVTVDLYWALRNAESVLETHGGAPTLVLTDPESGSVLAESRAENLWRLWKSMGRRTGCRRLLSALYSDLYHAARDREIGSRVSWALKAKKGVYKRGLGLGV
ncbi:CRISPR-associated helicase Cas3' [Aeropyrum pernix]|nr:CRISPR-associated helicase Cas3' [Aeropyrum pernix]